MKLIFILLAFFSGLSHAGQFRDVDVIFSRNTISSFFDAAECLSLRASIEEKKSFMTAKIMALDWDMNSGEMMSNEWVDSYSMAADSDVIEVLNAVRRHCPMTSRRIIANTRADGYEHSETHPEVLADIVVRVISVEILDKDEHRRIFEWNNKALGVQEIY